jgi:hypothetical protein
MRPCASRCSRLHFAQRFGIESIQNPHCSYQTRCSFAENQNSSLQFSQRSFIEQYTVSGITEKFCLSVSARTRRESSTEIAFA